MEKTIEIIPNNKSTKTLETIQTQEEALRN